MSKRPTFDLETPTTPNEEQTPMSNVEKSPLDILKADRKAAALAEDFDKVEELNRQIRELEKEEAEKAEWKEANSAELTRIGDAIKSADSLESVIKLLSEASKIWHVVNAPPSFFRGWGAPHPLRSRGQGLGSMRKIWGKIKGGIFQKIQIISRTMYNPAKNVKVRFLGKNLFFV